MTTTTLPRENYASLDEVIGNTPLVETESFTVNNIYQKLEYTNPSGSHYDRVYLPTIAMLESEGLIAPGDELRDITSGSAGISLSMIGTALGYKVSITVPDELPHARVAPMVSNGAEVTHCGPGYIRSASQFQRGEILNLLSNGWSRIRSADPDMRAVILENDDRRICYVNHSENLLSPKSFETIGDELIDQLEDNQPFAVILAMGNWTTISGIASVINHSWPATKIIGYEGQNRQIHDNYGTSVDGVPLRFRDDSLLDAHYEISDAERDDMDRRFNDKLPSSQQIGHSSLMGLVVAEQVVDTHQEYSRPVICLAYDQKSRY